MTDLDEHGRPQPPINGDEAATLLGFLDYQRATFAWRTAGLDSAGLQATVGVSSMNLGGMMKHLALVEDWWFSQWVQGRESEAAWVTGDMDADPDWEWHSAVDDSPEQLRALWEASVAESRSVTAEALAKGDLDQPACRSGNDGWRPSLRWILTHMIEEYARHNGHADLIREAVDGETGE